MQTARVDKKHSANLVNAIARQLAASVVPTKRLTAAALALPEPHVGQAVILADEARYRVVVCGRQFGKTYTGQIEVIKRLMRGEACWWLAPSWYQGRQPFEAVKAALEPLHDVIYINNSDRYIRLPNGGTFEVKTAHDPDRLRGKSGLDFVVLDEAAFLHPAVWSQIVRPMLLARQGRALFLSSPNGRNWFYELYTRGLDETAADWSAHHFTSMDNPTIARDEFAQIRRESTDRVWREEYLAEFLDDAGSVFRNVFGAVDLADTKPEAGRRYVMGVDWGRDNDFTVLTVIEVETLCVVAVDRFNEIGYSLQRGRLERLAREWGVEFILAEANSIGTVNIEELQAAGLPVEPFMTTARSKAPLIEGLALAIERGELALPDDPVMLNELKAYEIQRLSTSTVVRYSAPPGFHDDTVVSLALAYRAALSGGDVILGFA